MFNPIENYIAPDNLFGLVKNTAPFLAPAFEKHPLPAGLRLIDAGHGAQGYLQVLNGWDRFTFTEESDIDAVREDYFAYCLACHHATVATYVPTDVDSKIRGLLWRQTRDRDSRRRLFDFALRSLNWSIDGISKRGTALTGGAPVSGHNGEQLSVLAGALGAFVKAADDEYAEHAANAIESELAREAAEFDFALAHKGCELDALRLAASLTHNVGDLDQGISFWPTQPTHDPPRARFGRLAHENTKPYNGNFQRAALLYKRAMSTEGHRNYPLRGVKALRRSADLLLPLGPFFDEWGGLVAVHSALSWEDRGEILAALVHGCRTIPNQRGYFRALHGMVDVLGGNLERVLRFTPARTRAEWKDPDLRRQLAVSRTSFESMMRKMAAAAATTVAR